MKPLNLRPHGLLLQVRKTHSQVQQNTWEPIVLAQSLNLCCNAQVCARTKEAAMRHFALIPGALEAMPSHTWISSNEVIEREPSRLELRAAVRRAEAHLRLVRARLNPET